MMIYMFQHILKNIITIIFSRKKKNFLGRIVKIVQKNLNADCYALLKIIVDYEKRAAERVSCQSNKKRRKNDEGQRKTNPINLYSASSNGDQNALMTRNLSRPKHNTKKNNGV